MKKGRQASLYLMVLLLTSLFLVLGMAYLAAQGPEARVSQDVVESAQAYELARAGVEECRLKLAKDQRFPPTGGLESRSFTYSESLRDGEKRVGTYRITVDLSRDGPPHHLYEIISRGYTGVPGKPGAEAEVRCWISSLTLQVVRWHE